MICNQNLRDGKRCDLTRGHNGNHRTRKAIDRRYALLREQRASR